MPRAVRNTQKRSLTEAEIEDFERVGCDEKQIKFFEEQLKRTHWDFWARASELYLSLAAGNEVVFTSGKMRTNDTVTSAKFFKNFFSTTSREVARLIFMSDPYRDGKVKLAEQQVEDEAQAKYLEFKTQVLSSPENVRRLKEDLARLEA